jgi:hypothetical protein
MRRLLFPLTALAPAQVWSRSYVHGSGALTTRGASWSGDSVAIATCDGPAASGVALSVGVTPPPAGDAPTPAGVAAPPVVAPPSPIVTAESKPVVAVSTVTRLARRPAAGCPPWSRECRRPESHPRPAGRRRPCRKHQAESGTRTEAEWTNFLRIYSNLIKLCQL